MRTKIRRVFRNSCFASCRGGDQSLNPVTPNQRVGDITDEWFRRSGTLTSFGTGLISDFASLSRKSTTSGTQPWTELPPSPLR